MEHTHAKPLATGTDRSPPADAPEQAPVVGHAPAAAIDGDHAPSTPPDLAHGATASAEHAAPAAAQGPRRTLRLVITLRPDDGPGYRALLALGADGCDPLFRSASVPALAAVLGKVAELAAEAEARWRSQPRYPGSAVRRVKPAATRGSSGNGERPETPAEALPSVEPSATVPAVASQPEQLDVPPAPTAKATGQLTLFS